MWLWGDQMEVSWVFQEIMSKIIFFGKMWGGNKTSQNLNTQERDHMKGKDKGVFWMWRSRDKIIPLPTYGRFSLCQALIHITPFNTQENKQLKNVCVWKHRRPRGYSGKESTCQCGRCRFNPWVGKIPRSRNWQPTSVFLPGESLTAMLKKLN